MKRLFTLLLLVVLTFLVIGCSKPQDDELISEVGEISAYGFRIGSYVYKEEVYLAPYYSRSLWKKSEFADGYVYQLEIDKDKTYQMVDINLEDYFKDKNEYNNKFNYEDIEHIIYVKEDRFINIQDSHLIMIDKNNDLYLALGTFNPNINHYAFTNVLSLTYIGTQINKINLAKNNKKPYIGKDIINYLEDFKTSYSNLEEFLNSQLHHKINDKVAFNTSGIFYEQYKVSDNIILEISESSNKVEFTLSGLKEIKFNDKKYYQVVEICQDPNLFEKFIYTYSPELFDSFTFIDLLTNPKIEDSKVYSLDNIAHSKTCELIYVSTLFSSVINRCDLTEEQTIDAINVLKNVKLKRITDFERISLPSLHEFTYTLTINGVKIGLATHTENIMIINGVAFNAISGYDEFFTFCQTLLKTYN